VGVGSPPSQARFLFRHQEFGVGLVGGIESSALEAEYFLNQTDALGRCENAEIQERAGL
jgi:hypothetical protein